MNLKQAAGALLLIASVIFLIEAAGLLDDSNRKLLPDTNEEFANKADSARSPVTPADNANTLLEDNATTPRGQLPEGVLLGLDTRGTFQVGVDGPIELLAPIQGAGGDISLDGNWMALDDSRPTSNSVYESRITIVSLIKGRTFTVAGPSTSLKLQTPIWSPDGSGIAYIAFDQPSTDAADEQGDIHSRLCMVRVVVRNRGGRAGTPPICYPETDKSARFDWSPTSKQLVIESHPLGPLITTVSTGRSKRLLTDHRNLAPSLREAGIEGVGVATPFGPTKWSPSGDFIATVVLIARNRESQERYMLPVVFDLSGEIVDYGLPAHRVMELSWAPDTDRLAYTASQQGSDGYLHKLSAFLFDMNDINAPSRSHLLVSSPDAARMDLQLRWSPSGRWIAVAEQERTWIVDTETKRSPYELVGLPRPPRTPGQQITLLFDWAPAPTP